MMFLSERSVSYLKIKQKNQYMRHLVSIFIFTLVTTQVYAQLSSLENLDDVSKKGFFKSHIKGFFSDFTDFGDPFTMSGSVGLNMRSYNAFGGPLRQDPFFYTLNTNLNVRIYQIDLPFSMVLTAKNDESSLPNLKDIKDAFKDKVPSFNKRFVRFGMSPRYKWAKLHLGHRSMSFSKYTLDNLNFNGVGAELNPGKIRLAGMYGQLARAEPVDLSLVTPNVPVYQRHGWGAKVGYGDEQSSIDMILFKAKDDQNSIFIPSNLPVQPTAEENLSLGINAQKLFFEKIRIKLEYARSAVSPNALDAPSNESNLTSFLLKQRTTTQNSSALDASLGYEGKAMNASVQYKRVDPNYRTFGAYFFNRDIVEVLGNLNFGLWDNKINFALSSGVQSNNLDLSKPATTQRIIYAGSAGLNLGGFSVNGNYNNNSTDVGYVLNQKLDSLNAVIVTKDIGLNVTYTIPSEGGSQHSFSLSGNIQDVNDDIVNLQASAKSKVAVYNFAYNVVFENKWNLTARTNYNENAIAEILIKRYGGGFGLAKSFMNDKINFGWDNNYFINNRDGIANSNNLLSQLNLGFQIGSGLSANVNWGFLRTTAETLDPFSESTAMVGVQYNFNYKPGGKKEEKPASK